MNVTHDVHVELGDITEDMSTFFLALVGLTRNLLMT